MRSRPSIRSLRSFGRLPAVPVLVALLLALPAAAHDLWIEPADFTPAAGATLPLELRVGVGHPGEALGRNPDLLRRFALLGPDGELPIPGLAGASPAGLLALPAGSVGDRAVVFRGGESFVELEPGLFREYLEEEGLDDVLAARAAAGAEEQPGRELFSRSVKALLSVGESGPEVTASVHLRPTGLPLELVPEARPADLAPGDPLAVRLLWNGAPLAGAQVRALPHQRPSEVQAVRTDAEGRAKVRLDRSGAWRLAAVHMEPAGDHPEADWRSTWTSLTFELTEGPPARAEAAAGRDGREER